MKELRSFKYAQPGEFVEKAYNGRITEVEIKSTYTDAINNEYGVVLVDGDELGFINDEESNEWETNLLGATYRLI